MLSVAESPGALPRRTGELRRQEFQRLDDAGIAYLDYTGAGLHADRQITRHLAELRRAVFGNPHAESEPSLAATEMIDDARRRVLRFFSADPAQYTVIFTANCSAAIKLVAEAYSFGRLGSLVLSSDNHNSVNGIREYARRLRAGVTYIPLDPELRLGDPGRYLRPKRRGGRRLFAFPAQSNFSGVQHPLSLIADAQSAGFDVLLDAAAFAPSNALSLRKHQPEFVVVSFYKIFGYPTGVGALVARRDALARLNRPWFAGGTVNFASVQNGNHELKDAPEAFEDGTPNFATLAALRHGFDFLEEIGMGEIHAHVARLTALLIDGLREIARRFRAVRIYGPVDGVMRGGTVAFNLVDRDGRAVSYSSVNHAARDRRIAIRGGCFCNPGAAEYAFAFEAERALKCFRSTSARGFTIERFAQCLGDGFAVGASRASVGLATNDRDVERLLDLVDSMSQR